MQASRALMISSILMGAFGILATLVGMKCSKVGGENYILKGKMSGMGGVFYLLQGMCTMIAVSWYAVNITQDFFNPLNPVNPKFDIGEGLFFGWGSAALAICAGSCLICACRFKSSEKKLPYPYQSPTRGTVYSAAPGSHPSALTHSQYGRNAYI
ncbi:claudin-19-like [Esox lucius]|nr:claudin-19-like [Esox lucius]